MYTVLYLSISFTVQMKLILDSLLVDVAIDGWFGLPSVSFNMRMALFIAFIGHSVDHFGEYLLKRLVIPSDFRYRNVTSNLRNMGNITAVVFGEVKLLFSVQQNASYDFLKR